MHLMLLYGFIFIVGLCIGSFINMAAYRIPKMLYFSWFIDSYEFLNLQPKFHKSPSLQLNLCFPSSHCPNCKKKIAFFDNIPVVSYCLLKAKCRNCQKKIAVSYPLIELLSAVSSLVVAYKFGIEYKLIFTLLLTWILILQSTIDTKEYIIPDEITLPILWLGLIINNFNMFTNLSSAVIGAVAGYLSFWIIYWIFKLITGKDGMGYGDFKLLAMLGAWFGYQKLLLIILISSAIGSLVGGTLILLKRHDRNAPIPFGPYLAIAGWVAMLFGDLIDKWYFKCY